MTAHFCCCCATYGGGGGGGKMNGITKMEVKWLKCHDFVRTASPDAKHIEDNTDCVSDVICGLHKKADNSFVGRSVDWLGGCNISLDKVISN